MLHNYHSHLWGSHNNLAREAGCVERWLPHTVIRQVPLYHKGGGGTMCIWRSLQITFNCTSSWYCGGGSGLCPQSIEKLCMYSCLSKLPVMNTISKSVIHCLLGLSICTTGSSALGSHLGWAPVVCVYTV